MSKNANSRLYHPPDHTLETLEAIISGSTSRDKIADELGVTKKTANNKIHDPLHLGLLERNGEKIEATEAARRLVQLQDESVLEERFVELPGTDTVLERLENGGITEEDIGRIISFETNSGAAASETFKQYGRVYAQWIGRLGLGEVDGSGKKPRQPLENNRGANNPRVPPQKVLDCLRVMDEVETHEELAKRMDYSERYTQKILTTAYALGVARRKRGGGFFTTEGGRTVTTTSQGKQKELLRNKLLEIPLVQAYCNEVPSGEFKNKEVMKGVVKEYSLGWSDGTINTRAKRLYRWLIFTNLAEEKSPGVLETTEKIPRGNLPDP